MTKPVSSVPNSFATATSTIPLSQLDTDFNTITQYLNDLNNYSNYVADTGTANAIILNFPSGITTTTIATGTQLQFKAANANTSSTTIQVQVNSSTILTATTVLNEDGSTLSGNTILSGGIYTVIYNGTNWILSGGGAGGGYASSPFGTGGAGGGGNGGPTASPFVGVAGTANTGGGGGGAGTNTSPGTTGVAGNGGSGVVILSVPTANYSGTTTGSPTITTSGSNTIIKFTGTGTYTA